MSASLLAAVRSPLTFSPDALFPEKVKTGIFESPYCSTFFLDSYSSPAYFMSNIFPTDSPTSTLCGRSGLGRGCWSTAKQAGTTVNHFLQFIHVAGTRERHFQSNLLLQVRGGKCLIERLHTKFFLARLHGGINLMDLVFTNQVADSRIRHQNLHDHCPSLVIRLGNKGLAHDAFQHHGKLRANLWLLVSRKHVDDTVDD